MLKKITKCETEDGDVFDTQEYTKDYIFGQDKEVMTRTTEQERADVLHALEESQSLLAAMLHEARPVVEIQKQMRQNRDDIEAAQRVSVQLPEPAVPFAIFDYLGFYAEKTSAKQAKDFCDHYNGRDEDGGSAPYEVQALYTEQQVIDLLKSVGVPVKQE